VADRLQLRDGPLPGLDAGQQHPLQVTGAIRDALESRHHAGGAKRFRLASGLVRRVPSAAHLLDRPVQVVDRPPLLP